MAYNEPQKAKMVLCCHIERPQSAIFEQLKLTNLPNFTNVPLRKGAISEKFAISFSSFSSLFPSNGGDNGEKPPPSPMVILTHHQTRENLT
jgi:hypothetical protein